MIVVWSGLSIKSDYVRAEAGEGAERGILFPVMLEEVRIPLPFRQLQTARLIDWRGEPRHPEFERLVRDLSALLGPPPASPPAEAEPPVRPSTPAEDTRSTAQISARRADTGWLPHLLGSPLSKMAAALVAGTLLFAFAASVFKFCQDPRPNSNVVPTPTAATPTATPTPTATVDASKAELLDKVKVTYVKFFHGECPPKPNPKMFIEGVKRSDFPKTRWYLEMEHPEAARRVEFEMYAEVYDPDGLWRRSISLPNAVIDPKRTFSWQCSRTPRGEGNSLDYPAGRYRVEFRLVNGLKHVRLYEATLEVY